VKQHLWSNQALQTLTFNDGNIKIQCTTFQKQANPDTLSLTATMIIPIMEKHRKSLSYSMRKLTNALHMKQNCWFKIISGLNTFSYWFTLCIIVFKAFLRSAKWAALCAIA